jgi:arylsulfatase A-like enzyme
VPEGIVCSELLSQYDFRPTILEYLNCGDADTEPLPGKSFAPLLTGDRIRGNDRVVVFDEYGPVRMIRTREWKYIHRYLNGPCELYNLSLDPGEENNLIQNEAHVKQAERMKKELEEWFAEFAVPDLDVTHTDVDGGGQIHSLRECGNDAAFFKNQNWSLPLRSRQ